MHNLLFDSSVWINYFRNSQNRQTDLLHTGLLSDWSIWICPPIQQEVLQGIKHPGELRRVQDKFTFLERLEIDPYQMADQAAGLFRSLRQQGITIRKPNDCLIAAYAIHFNLQLVHNDIDFDRIANHLPKQEGTLQVWIA